MIFFINLLNRKRKLQLLFAALITIFTAFLEVISIGSIGTLFSFFVGVNENFSIGIINLNPINNWGNNENNIIFLSLIFAFILLLTTIFRLFAVIWNTKLASIIATDLTGEAFLKIISQPYFYFLRNDSSKAIATLTTHAFNVFSFIRFIIQILSSGFIIICILLLLISKSFTVTILTAFMLFIVYFSSGLIFKNKLRNNSKIQKRYNSLYVSNIQESLKSIRYLKLNSLEKDYYHQAKSSFNKLTSALAKTRIISIIPRYLIELPGLIIIISFSIVDSLNKGDIKYAIPTASSLAFAYQRLLPLVQQFYSAFVNIQGNLSSYKLVGEAVNLPVKKFSKKENKRSKKFQFNNLYFKDICFQYPDTNRLVLNKLNLKISRGEKLAIIGASGAGKSTILDIISGLIIPSNGDFIINNKNLYATKDSFFKEWQSSIAYIPQTTYISNDTIKNNIAFGQNQNIIDERKINEVIDKVYLREVIESFQEKENTFVGESGVNLSGGQRQRLAIARALYSKKDILILDEATNALDPILEEDILKMIIDNKDELTVIIVSHNIKSLRNCKRAILLNNNCVELDGPASKILTKYNQNS